MAKSTKRSLVQALNEAAALHQTGNFVEARRRYKAILRIKPDHFDVLHNFGLLEAQHGNFEDAGRLISQALKINAQSAQAHFLLGDVFSALRRCEESLASYDRALAIQPNFAQALHNRGNVLHDLKRYEEALDSYQKALAIDANYADAYNSQGHALHELRRSEAALESYDHALTIDPRYAEAHNNRGNTLRQLDRYVEALASYDRALALDSSFVEAYENRGTLLRNLKKFELASRDFEQILKLRADYPYVLGNLLNLKLQCCDWRNYHEDLSLVISQVRSGARAITPFDFLAVSDSSQDQLLCSRILVGDRFAILTLPKSERKTYSHDRIRVAYLSSDFHEHATAYLIAELLERHDKSRFEITAISFGPNTKSAIRTRLENACEKFIDVREKTDSDIAQLVRELEIDIAVDLKGFTYDSRPGIFSFRPAPIQVNYLGYPGTLGADYIDYILADRWVIPPEQEHCYTEKVVYLPDSYQANDTRRCLAERIPSRTEAGLPASGFVFCSFNGAYKLTPQFFDIWMRLLRRVEGSVLWLLGENESAIQNLRREAQTRGVASDRLVFARRIDLEEHLARHRLADLFLDNLPCNAHTTTSDALWAGLPVLTCLGTTFAGRVAASLLDAIGLPELITHSVAEYEALAFKLATDRQALMSIQSKLNAQRETYPLFDTDRFRRHIEAAYETMWERHQRGEKPQSFSVAPID